MQEAVNYIEFIKSVKLNNPLMGTETRRVLLSIITVNTLC